MRSEQGCEGRRTADLKRFPLLPMGLEGRKNLEASLGKLVKLDLRPKADRSRGKKKPGNAQILMFTGVRYERGPLQPPTTRLDPTRPKRKRG